MTSTTTRWMVTVGATSTSRFALSERAIHNSRHERRNGRPRALITVGLGGFGTVIRRGLEEILGEDSSLATIEIPPGVAIQSVAKHATLDVGILGQSVADDLRALRQLTAARPRLGVIVLAAQPTRAYATHVLAAGASCLTIEASASEVLAAVHLAARGRCSAGATGLTARQTAVLDQLRTGQSYDEVAQTLQIGIETVRTHAAVIRQKLGVKKKRELIGMSVPASR